MDVLDVIVLNIKSKSVLSTKNRPGQELKEVYPLTERDAEASQNVIQVMLTIFSTLAKAQRLLEKGCVWYLAYVVKEFSDVFPDDLPSSPTDEEIEFFIDLIPRTSPISKAPYQMMKAKLEELKKQLQELLDKSCIRPSVSP
ncbi:uncharacterized protein LOC110816259 [Carica papaya]|uniref:uncharacterized protein LOC110816259 n=1 Tax=Carica papaya TaxID=3649 RepID=UPI000B8CEE64|nr:uncharacterized protein LOC110816259 [Carica papaya]